MRFADQRFFIEGERFARSNMHSSGKSDSRWGKGFLLEELRGREKTETNRKVAEPLDAFLIQTMGDPYASLANRPGDKPYQCIYLPEALDQHLASKLPRGGMKLDLGLEVREGGVDDCSPAGVRDSSSNALSGIGGLRTLQTTGERMQTLKVPHMVAIAQAAVKAHDFPGWPLSSPAKIQSQKCEKCSQEFYSLLNYRRHIRIHRRSLQVKKEDLRKEKTRIASFWNKLTPEAASEIFSMRNATIEDLSGLAVVKSLTALMQQPRSSLLPQAFLKSGTGLLDFLEGEGLTDVPADELFSILDSSSENTFLCGGTSPSVQRSVFLGEASKVGLEDRNLVASLAFLIEQKLVNAWIIDKDKEALRCQKELVEEEEADQKRREKILEKKRQKKLRQKEKEKKEATLQLLFQDQEDGSIDDDNILRVDDEGNSPFSSGSSSMSLESSRPDFNRMEASDTEIAHLVSQVEENIVLKSMYTVDQLVSPAFEEEPHDEEPQSSFGYLPSFQEEHISRAGSQNMEMNHIPEHSSVLGIAKTADHGQVHQEISSALKDESAQSENNHIWKHSKSSSLPKKFSRLSRASGHAFNGSAIWAKKTQIRYASDKANVEETTTMTSTGYGQSDNLAVLFKALAPNSNKVASDLSSSQDSPKSTFSGTLSPGCKFDGSIENREFAPNVDCHLKSFLHVSDIEPCAHTEDETICDSTNLHPSNLCSDTNLVKNNCDSIDTSRMRENGSSYIKTVTNSCEQVETFEEALMIGSLEIPLMTLVNTSKENRVGSENVTGKFLGKESSFIAPVEKNPPEYSDNVVCSEEEPQSSRFPLLIRSEGYKLHTFTELATCDEQHTVPESKQLRTGAENMSESNAKAPDQTLLALEKEPSLSSTTAELFVKDGEANVEEKWSKKEDDNFYSKSLDPRWPSISDIAVAAFLSQRWNLAIKAVEARVTPACN